MTPPNRFDKQLPPLPPSSTPDSFHDHYRSTAYVHPSVPLTQMPGLYDGESMRKGFRCFEDRIAPGLADKLRHPADQHKIAEVLWDWLPQTTRAVYIQRSNRLLSSLPQRGVDISEDVVARAYAYLTEIQHPLNGDTIDCGGSSSPGGPVIPKLLQGNLEARGIGGTDHESLQRSVGQTPALEAKPLEALEDLGFGTTPTRPLSPVMGHLKALPHSPPLRVSLLLNRSNAPVHWAHGDREWDWIPIFSGLDVWSPYYEGLTGPDPDADKSRRNAALAMLFDMWTYYDILRPDPDSSSSSSSSSNYPNSEDDTNSLEDYPLCEHDGIATESSASPASSDYLDYARYVFHPRGQGGLEYNSSLESRGSLNSMDSYPPSTDRNASPLSSVIPPTDSSWSEDNKTSDSGYLPSMESLSLRETESSSSSYATSAKSSPPDVGLYRRVVRNRTRTGPSSFVHEDLLNVSRPQFPSIPSTDPLSLRSELCYLSPEEMPQSELTSEYDLADDEEELYWEEAEVDSPPRRAHSL